MPITTHDQLEALRAEVREAIVHSIAEALALLTKDLPVGRAKHNQVLLLTSRARDIADHDINNTLTPELLDVLRNELRRDVLTFTDHLTLADFGPEAPARPELKPGHLLYKVSPRMTVRETYGCLIRIAHQLNQVLEGIELDDSVSFEELPVSEVMEVVIIDPSPADDPAFDILLLSDGEQLVDEFGATDWVFNVRPLRAGEHRLVLKISVLITVGGKERTKNIVLQRPISVSTEAVEAVDEELVRVTSTTDSTLEQFEQVEPGRPVSHPQILDVERGGVVQPSSQVNDGANAGGDVVTELPPAPQRPPAPPKGRSGQIRYLSVAASILLVVSFAWFLLPTMFNGPSTDVITSPPPIDEPGVIIIDNDSLGRDSLR